MAKPREIYEIYMSAFTRGASHGEIDAALREHEDPDIRRAWESGYLRGCDVRKDAQERAKVLSQYEPSILRTQDSEGES